MRLKVVVVGGGSSYTPEIIEGLINRHEQFPVSNIVLVDIEAGKEKLEIIGNLSARMIEKSGKPISISWTLDRKKALKNADFVSTQIRVGGLEARSKDERIPLSHGDRKSTRLNSSHVAISYAVFCLKKKNIHT